MDDRLFDLFAQSIARRGLLASIATSALLVPGTVVAATACSQNRPGERCRRGAECCSGVCKRKGKKRKGQCRCGALLAPCFDNFDCCDADPGNPGRIVCSNKNGRDDLVCCVSFGGSCQADADCCAEAFCDQDRICSTT